MKKFIKIFFMISIVLEASLFGSYQFNQSAQNEVYIYCGNHEKTYKQIKNKIEAYGIALKEISKLDKACNKLHIIFDAQLVPFEYFPKHYIVYQTLNFDEIPLTKGYLEKLNNAVAVWDPSYKNISSYSLILEHYYNFKEEHLDPLVLPCLLPTDKLHVYKEVLRYSNAKDTDISSHLPIIFAHCLLQQPKIIIELGIRSGESSYAFKNAIEHCDTKIIGIDIDSQSEKVYPALGLHNYEFKNMDDRDFPAWKDNNGYQEMKADIIFIDTSHYYDHTLQELEAYIPLLEKNGLLIFHDTNMCPLNKCTYQRINNTCGIGWDNEKGVARAIKDYFYLSFNEADYTTLTFSSHNHDWTLLHYPYCNGLTLIKKLN